MPALLKDAARDIDLKIQDADAVANKDHSEDANIQTIKVKVRGFEGEKAISMNTNALENKINAI